LLAADVTGKIIEWNMSSRTYEIEYLADPENSGKTAIIPSGVAYTSVADSFAVAYHYPLDYPRQDEIAIFEIGTVEPVKKVSVEAGFETDEMMIDRSQDFIALVPVLGPRVLIHSARDGEFIKDLEFPYPVSSFAFNRARDEAVAALTDGSIYIFDLPNFDIRKIMNFSDIPIITKINIAPSGKLLAIGCDSPQKTTLSGNKNEIHVVDIEKNIIVRSARKTASDPLALEFGPTSAALLVGATSQPQLSLWNLEVPPQGEFFHGLSQLGGSLNDIAFSPAGNAIASAGDRNGELATSNFTYAETDENDTLFSIELPVLEYSVSSVPSQYLGHHESLTYTTAVCNIADVPLYIDDAFFKTGTHFSAEYITIPDTLWPGECIDLVIDYKPLIVGDIADTLIFEACSNDIEMPVSSKGLARNIDFFTTKLEMGEVCVGSETTKSFKFLVNKDPVPLHINQIKADENGVAQFMVIQPLSDTLLMPGEELTITVKFMPRESGHIDRVMEIFHSGVPEYKRSVDIHGFGLGTIYDLSHFDLRFIPEVTDREIEVINDSKNVIYIEEIIFDEPGLLTILTPLPLEIPAFGSETIRIRTNQTIDSESKMEIIAGPCSISYDVTFGPYSGTSHVQIPEVNADPRGNAVIPLNYANTDTAPYAGVRPFRAEFTMNPRLFLPQTVVSDYGTGELIRNDIINDKRIIGIEVWGDFPYEGVLAEVKGVAGLAETDRSPIDFIDESKFWGVNVETTYESGMFILINVDDGRRIIQDNNLVLKTISPNPVSDDFSVEFESLESADATVIVYDNLGNQLLSSGLIHATAGTNTLTMSAATISSGTYRVVVRRGVFSSTKTIVIIR
jgi:WD40 repeat protein